MVVWMVDKTVASTVLMKVATMAVAKAVSWVGYSAVS